MFLHQQLPSSPELINSLRELQSDFVDAAQIIDEDILGKVQTNSVIMTTAEHQSCGLSPLLCV